MNAKEVVKCAIVFIALVIAYLFALNGRYTKVDVDAHFDKWTKTILIIGKEKYIE